MSSVHSFALAVVRTQFLLMVRVSLCLIAFGCIFAKPAHASVLLDAVSDPTVPLIQVFWSGFDVPPGCVSGAFYIYFRHGINNIGGPLTQPLSTSGTAQGWDASCDNVLVQFVDYGANRAYFVGDVIPHGFTATPEPVATPIGSCVNWVGSDGLLHSRWSNQIMAYSGGSSFLFQAVNISGTYLGQALVPFTVSGEASQINFVNASNVAVYQRHEPSDGQYSYYGSFPILLADPLSVATPMPTPTPFNNVLGATPEQAAPMLSSIDTMISVLLGTLMLLTGVRIWGMVARG